MPSPSDSASERYRRAYRARAAAARADLARARREAWIAAARAVEAVVSDHRPRRVLLIGSLPRGTFRPGSDIDLAVEGLAPDEAERAEAAARRAAGLPVDVRRLESMDPGWRAHHERFGKVVHARG